MNTSALRRPVAPVAIAAALLTSFLLLLAPLSAAAHDTLLESNPAADSTIETLPHELTLTFSANLIDGEGSTEMVVMDAAGNSVTDGPPVLNGTQVTQPLVTEADAGVYRVIWKVVSSDGHSTSEEFSFTVTTSTLSATPSADPNTEPSTEPTAEESAEPSAAPTADETTAPADDSDASMLPWIIVGVLVVAALGATVLLLVSRARRRATASGSGAQDSATDHSSER